VPLEALKTVVEQEEEQGEKREEESRPLVRNPNWKYVATVRGQLRL
jgi:hypothetical protein